MPTTLAEASSLPVNPVTAYLRELQHSKTGLPHGQLVCVSASPTVTTTDALLRLAASVGPHIAIFQVHADIIDDWSSYTVHELTLLAKKHNFLLWEGGRLLNFSSDIPSTSQAESRERRREDVDMVRRMYTKGVVSVASWAGLATSWASAVPAQQQDSDILIPLKGPLTTSRTVMMLALCTICARRTLTLTPIWSPPVRRASTISLTRSITQHSEPSSPSSPRDTLQPSENITENGIYADWPNALSPSPLLARGLVLCLPSATDFPFSVAYRDSCLAAARANRDFVVGFLCNEPWTLVSQRSDVLDVNRATSGGDKRDGDSPAQEEREESFIIFSPLHADAGPQPSTRDGNRSSSVDWDRTRSSSAMDTIDESSASTQPNGLSAQAKVLHATISRAIESRDSGRNMEPVREGTSPAGHGLLHIPIVTLGL
ncbi:hypothetical protein T310_1840 [Rasamsonia emersonii CBS 393.64]|uniref:Uncharacterized protein n=1 Tax=Rasamsonia emersonii (strain ATCC 16479 / CBS 393.64 / IMI 116815) TaxID=1408163 RepID=A0A0F4Z0R5_RASE3|nr:hypothetical protein T310_1840 [Rasamsonia emersonii CBS 393.64]KKA24109.1 hypothetical protein T310_1840 [Rasamsonia emersonii CBS 393.64]